jgi:hypothetical protein
MKLDLDNIDLDDIPQPVDKDNALYKMARDKWIDGDAKDIQKRLKLATHNQVYDILGGRSRSRRVWKEIMRNTIKRLKAEAIILKYAKQAA